MFPGLKSFVFLEFGLIWACFYPPNAYISRKQNKIKQQEVNNMTTAYCVKCRGKIEIKNEQKVKLKNGKPATKGECAKCGTKVFRIGG
jgi:hypothetical protein